jgi:preprotein translocase subunit SecG
MDTFILVLHMIIAVALVGLVLIQKSEGGGLMGPSSTGMAPIRGSANVLTRATSILATLFFITSITLAIMAGSHRKAASIVDNIATKPAAEAPAVPAVPAVPAAPVSE